MGSLGFIVALTLRSHDATSGEQSFLRTHGWHLKQCTDNDHTNGYIGGHHPDVLRQMLTDLISTRATNDDKTFSEDRYIMTSWEYFPCHWFEQTFEQGVELLVTWDALTHMWRHSYGNGGQHLDVLLQMLTELNINLGNIIWWDILGRQI